MLKRIPTDGIPGVRVLPFIQAPKYSPGMMADVRAIVWHFAEGGGTDTWLTRQDGAQGNNSCHIVVKYDGSIRQIVAFDAASWSLHWNESGSYTDFGIFDMNLARRVVGSNPNNHIIAIEVEGFWDGGPNIFQTKTIGHLAEYLEKNFTKAIHLGHRHFQNYKACPGPSLFMNLLPIAGRLSTEIDMPGLPITLPQDRALGGKVSLTKGTRAIRLHDRHEYIVPFAVTRVATRVHLAGDLTGPGYLVDLDGDVAHFVRDAGLIFIENPAEDGAELEAANARITLLENLMNAEEQDDLRIADQLRTLANELAG